MSDLANELRAAIGWQVGDVPSLIHAAADRIEALQAQNIRLKLALGQIRRRESPDAGRPYRFDEYGHYGESNPPLPPMEGKE